MILFALGLYFKTYITFILRLVRILGNIFFISGPLLITTIIITLYYYIIFLVNFVIYLALYFRVAIALTYPKELYLTSIINLYPISLSKYCKLK
jgi:hypothetical protein